MALKSLKPIEALERTIKLIENNGTWKIIKALVLIMVTLYVITNGAEFIDSLLRRVTSQAIKEEYNEKVEFHDKAMEVRKQIKPKIDEVMYKIQKELNADRVFVIEMHNGNNNPSGLPFIYGEMTYEIVSDGVLHVDEDYTGVNLSRFKLPYYIEQNSVWMGNIDELSEIDDKLSKRLSSNDVSYFVLTHMIGYKSELGYFGISYCNGKKPVEKEIIMNKMIIATQRISSFLDASNVLKEGRFYNNVILKESKDED